MNCWKLSVKKEESVKPLDPYALVDITYRHQFS